MRALTLFPFKKGKTIDCPHCLKPTRFTYEKPTCSKCNKEIEPLYADKFETHPLVTAQLVGYQQHGKTTFLYALSSMLHQLALLWANYYSQPATTSTQEIFKEVNAFYKTGKLPSPSSKEGQAPFVSLLNQVPRWGNRTVAIQDCGGEIFDNLTFDNVALPYLANSKHLLFVISLDDYRHHDRRQFDLLLGNYLNAGKKVGYRPQKVVVVLTKAEKVNLPSRLQEYLLSDPFHPISLPSATRSNVWNIYSQIELSSYLARMQTISNIVKSWFIEESSGAQFVSKAKDANLQTEYAIVSSVGRDLQPDKEEPWQPRRVLDPLFWMLEMEMQSSNTPNAVFSPPISRGYTAPSRVQLNSLTDEFSGLERKLKVLRERLSNNMEFASELNTFEIQLNENVTKARMGLGSSELDAQRYAICQQLNRLSFRALGCWFNELEEY